MISIPQPRDSFAKTFSKYSFKTLQIKEEIIAAQQDIYKECGETATRDIYHTNIPQTLTVDEFNQLQASAIS